MIKVPYRRFQEFLNKGDWKQRKFEDIFKLSQGLQIEISKRFTEPGKDRYFYITNEFLKEKCEEKYYIESPAANVICEKDDILMTRTGNTGIVVTDVEGCFHNNFFKIQYDKKNFSKKYICYLLSTTDMQKTILSSAGSSTIPDLSHKSFYKISSYFPDFEEQLKIGNYLADVDNLISLHQSKLEKAKALKSAYLSELFPTEGEFEPKRRFEGFTGAWKQGTIGEFGYFYYGKSAPKWSVTSDATTPCVRYGELYTKHKEKIDTIYSFTNIPRENLKFSTGNEVLVPRVGEDPLDFANCSWLSIPGVAIGEMISVYNTEQNPLFTAYMFNALFKYEFAKRVEGGNVSNLYYTKLENIPVSYPSIEEQNKIASFLDNLSTLIDFQQRKLEKLQNLKKAYLNEMFI